MGSLENYPKYYYYARGVIGDFKNLLGRAKTKHKEKSYVTWQKFIFPFFNCRIAF